MTTLGTSITNLQAKPILQKPREAFTKKQWVTLFPLASF